MPSFSTSLQARSASGVEGILMDTRDLWGNRTTVTVILPIIDMLCGSRAYLGMPCSSSSPTSFRAWLAVASVSYASNGEVWVCTRPARYGNTCLQKSAA